MKLDKFFAFSALSFGRQSGACGDSVRDRNAAIEVRDDPLPPPIDEDAFAHDDEDHDQQEDFAELVGTFQNDENFATAHFAERDAFAHEDDDAYYVAKSFGISVDEARKHSHQQDDFAELVGAFQKDESFVTAHFAEKLDGEFKVFYKNADVPAVLARHHDAIEKFKATNGNASLTIVKTRLSREEGERRRDRIHATLTGKGYSSIGSSTDGDTLEIIAKKPPGSSRRKNVGIMVMVDKFRAARILGLSDDDGDLDGLILTLWDYDDEDPFEDYHGQGHGGREVHERKGSFRKDCVSGFSVVDWCLALI